MHITILMHTYKTLSSKNPGTMTFTQIFTLFLYMYIHMHTYQPTTPPHICILSASQCPIHHHVFLFPLSTLSPSKLILWEKKRAASFRSGNQLKTKYIMWNCNADPKVVYHQGRLVLCLQGSWFVVHTWSALPRHQNYV